jgi:uncharacterized coiled-coil protein SlyX
MQDEERLIKIETMLVHQDAQINELLDAVELQRKDIAALMRQLDRANARVALLEEGGGAEESKGLSVSEQALRDKPPHY